LHAHNEHGLNIGGTGVGAPNPTAGGGMNGEFGFDPSDASHWPIAAWRAWKKFAAARRPDQITG
jgi:hypothetical protein